MKIDKIIKERENSISFEFFPPKTEQGETTLFETIDKLSVFNPSYVSVTYGAGGSTRDKTISIVERITKNSNLTVMPHLTCVGATRDETAEIVEHFAQMCATSVPQRLSELIDKYSDNPEDGRKAGIEYTTEQCRDLMKHGVKYLHFYTLNRWEAVTEIINNLSLA